MAYDPMQLSAAAYSNGWTMWHYRTEDSWKDITGDPWEDYGPNYFAGAAAMLRPGDLIHINARSETGGDSFSAWVLSNQDGVVVVEVAG